MKLRACALAYHCALVRSYTTVLYLGKLEAMWATHLLDGLALHLLHVDGGSRRLYVVGHRRVNAQLACTQHAAHFGLEALRCQHCIQCRVPIALLEALLYNCGALQELCCPNLCLCTLRNLQAAHNA